jgi:hypothetical protein
VLHWSTRRYWCCVITLGEGLILGTKLQTQRRQLTWDFAFASKDPHLEFANHNFESSKEDSKYREFFEDLAESVFCSHATLDKALRSGQEMFRQCLDWLSKGASIEFGHSKARRFEPELGEYVKKWLADPRVRFLDLHGMRHTGIALRPARVRWQPWRCSGIAFVQERAQRDPLDLLCWHIIHLYLDGDLRIKRCRYPGCQKFFKHENVRRIYCDDKCRALDHKKSPTEMRVYMRNYRAIKRSLKSKSGGFKSSPT